MKEQKTFAQTFEAFLKRPSNQKFIKLKRAVWTQFSRLPFFMLIGGNVAVWLCVEEDRWSPTVGRLPESGSNDLALFFLKAAICLKQLANSSRLKTIN